MPGKSSSGGAFGLQDLTGCPRPLLRRDCFLWHHARRPTWRGPRRYPHRQGSARPGSRLLLDPGAPAPPAVRSGPRPQRGRLSGQTIPENHRHGLRSPGPVSTFGAAAGGSDHPIPRAGAACFRVVQSIDSSALRTKTGHSRYVPTKYIDEISAFLRSETEKPISTGRRLCSYIRAEFPSCNTLPYIN